MNSVGARGTGSRSPTPRRPRPSPAVQRRRTRAVICRVALGAIGGGLVSLVRRFGGGSRRPAGENEDLCLASAAGRILSVQFSRDGEHLAYVEEMSGRTRVVRDGNPLGWFEAVKPETLALNRDGTRAAFVARFAAQWCVVAENADRSCYREVGPPRMGAGDRLAFWAERGPRQWCVVTEMGELAVSASKWPSIVFSRGGDRMAYISECDDVYFIRRNGGNGMIECGVRMGQELWRKTIDPLAWPR